MGTPPTHGHPCPLPPLCSIGSAVSLVEGDQRVKRVMGRYFDPSSYTETSSTHQCLQVHRDLVLDRRDNAADIARRVHDLTGASVTLPCRMHCIPPVTPLHIAFFVSTDKRPSSAYCCFALLSWLSQGKPRHSHGLCILPAHPLKRCT
jgi:hypothetical protein